MDKLIRFIFFAFAPTIALAQDATITQSAQRSIEMAHFHQNLVIVFIIICIFANKIIAVANFLLQNQPDVHPLYALSSFLPSTGQSSFKILDKTLTAVSFAKLTVINNKDETIFSKYAGISGTVRLSVPARSSVIIQAFGYAKRIVNSSQVTRKNTIVLKPQDEVSLGTENFSTKKFGQYLLTAATIIGIYLSFTVGNYYPASVELLVAIITVVNVLVLVKNSSDYTKLLDRNGKILPNQKITVIDSEGNKLKELTSKGGKIKTVITPGFYKISRSGTTTKTFEVKSKSPLRLKLKLN